VAYEAFDQRHLLLATLPPSQRQIRFALGVVAALVVAFAVTVPFANVQLGRIDAFIPIIATITVINDLITSALLCSQFYIVRRRALLVLASGYFFTALIVIPWALTFPGESAPTGFFGAGLQTAAWLYFFWHMGAPLALIAATRIADWDSKATMSQRSPMAAIGLSIAVVVAIVCGLVWVTTVGDWLLPRIFLSGVHVNYIVSLLIGGLIMTSDAAALALLWLRRRSVLDLWLMVMCCAWLFESTIVVTLVETRFSLSWYAARVFGLIATFVVLLVLLSETTALYANLARSIVRRRGARQARQVAMDAMAASIVHEISQPLTAMVSNADASLHWLTRAAPDLNKAIAANMDVVNEGNRVGEIIDSIRSMFRKGAHGRRQLAVNDLVREVLLLVDLELRTQQVTVTTDLRNGLPPLFADRGQLQQVFLNLAMNAIEAMSSVTGRARVLRVRSDMVEGSADVVVTVADSGSGIEGENKDRIFEPFYTTKSTGTGIGLTICRVIIESHGGSLRASANEPHGTIFQVTLPNGDL
jgi:signal transduction histidine kinase